MILEYKQAAGLRVSPTFLAPSLPAKRAIASGVPRTILCRPGGKRCPPGITVADPDPMRCSLGRANQFEDIAAIPVQLVPSGQRHHNGRPIIVPSCRLDDRRFPLRGGRGAVARVIVGPPCIALHVIGRGIQLVGQSA